jgi:hypothetical protein
MQQYPYNSPQILTDDVFLLYGGRTGTSSVAQRQIAYLLAEEQVTEHLSSFLVPTIITGSASYINGNLFSLEFGNVQSVLLVQLKTVVDNSPLDTREYTGTSLVREAQYGYVDIYSPALCGRLNNVEVVYLSGLSTGTYTNPSVLSTLTLAAQVNLNEIDISLSNEGTADIGIQNFSNQSYSEMRVKLGNTVFGNSAVAQRIARLAKKYGAKRGVLLR